MIISRHTFTQKVEEIRLKEQTNYIEACLQACEFFDVDIEAVKPLIGNPIKSKILADAKRLNFVQQETEEAFK